jgi:hypothetical protein
VHRLQVLAGRRPHETVGGVPVVDGGRRAGKTLDGIGETAQFVRMTLLTSSVMAFPPECRC